MGGMLLAAALFLSACSRSADEPIAQSAPEPAASYNAARGLKLTPLSSDFIGLAMAEFTGRVPAEAVLRTVEGTFVYVDNGGWLLRTPVEVDERSAADTGPFALAHGLYEGDRIAIRGVRALWLAELHFLRAGQACAHEG